MVPLRADVLSIQKPACFFIEKNKGYWEYVISGASQWKWNHCHKYLQRFQSKLPFSRSKTSVFWLRTWGPPGFPFPNVHQSADDWSVRGRGEGCRLQYTREHPLRTVIHCSGRLGHAMRKWCVRYRAPAASKQATVESGLCGRQGTCFVNFENGTLHHRCFSWQFSYD